MKVLLIEDNEVLARQIVEFMEEQALIVDHAMNARQGTHLALSETYDVIIVDVMLPDDNGFNVTHTIKQESRIHLPVLMLTARNALADKTQGFAAGADDYLTKPFDLHELLLRCQSLCRRHQLYQPKVLKVGPLALDTVAKTAIRDEQPLQLGQIPFQILELLVAAYPQPVSRAWLIHKIWGDTPPDTDALKSHIYQLRQALDRNFAHPMLKTVTNLGYRLELVPTHDL
ncbi:response regulator transcription factor [Pseudoalteromonas sp. T1lg48]|uniref:response regulator transcription factor n=1 Tax=Pseudoalteromonas sp. T1lg48 TaxID=2077100 RepID=UPI000CF68787|nr:response regulator transcription factor [Pseudoalteromonas sp. T1lg48]